MTSGRRPDAAGPRSLQRATVILCLALATGCGGSRSRPLTLRVAAVRQPATSLLYVAQAAGCFERERLTIQETSFELGRDAIALLGRDADVAVAFETVVARAALADTAARLRAISTLHRSTRNTRLLTNRRSGIQGFADLRGKRVGLSLGTNAESFIDLVLRFAGIGRADVSLVDLTPPAAAEALASGAIDAAVMSDPVASAIESTIPGARTLQSELYAEFSLLVARADVIEGRPAELDALVRGLVCGERFTREHPAESMRELRRRFPEISEDALRAQLARVTWGVGLDNLLLDVLRREAEWSFGATREHEAQELLDPRVLERVAPERVLLLPTPRPAP